MTWRGSAASIGRLWLTGARLWPRSQAHGLVGPDGILPIGSKAGSIRRQEVVGIYFSKPDRKGVVRFYVGIRVCDASTPRPHPVSRQSSSPVDPAKYPARAASGSRQERPANKSRRPASGSRRVSRQSSWPADPAEYPARAARQWIPPSIPSPVDPAEHPARVARQWIPPSISLSVPE